MATTVPDISQAMSDATAALATAMRGDSAPAGSPPPASDTAPVTPPQPTEAAPVAPPDQAATTTPPAAPSSDLSDPAAKFWLEKHGGDVAKALAAAVQNNNRLAALAKVHPEMFAPGGPADPASVDPSVLADPFAEPEVSPVAEPAVEPVQLRPEQVQGYVDQGVQTDPQCQRLIQTFTSNDTAIKGLQQEISGAQARVAYLNQKASDPDFASDPVKLADIRDALQRETFDLNIKEGRLDRLTLANERIDSQFRSLEKAIRENVEGALRTQAQEQAEEAQYTADVQRYRGEFKVQWPAALERAIVDFKIPTELQADFREDARVQALASQAPIHDIFAFVSPVAKRLMEKVDRYHRGQAAVYAKAAGERAIPPAAQPPSAAQTATPPNVTADDLESVMARARREARERGLR